MTRTLIEIDADIASIRGVMGSGAKRVKFADGREVEYPRVQDLAKALQILADERAVVAGETGSTAVVARYNSGLG